MITFVDEKGTEHSALVAYSVTNAVNGELSVKGTIYTNDKVLHGIGRGWRFRLDDEYFRITYAKPNDTGRQIEVEFDAVHQFFYDMSKSMVYTTLNGSKPFETYLQAIFSGSGYTYNLETTVGSIRKENFGNKSRLSLFNDIIKAAGLEFSVRGHVIRILKRIGTDLSTIVRKDFNMNELKIEKDINSFVTYQRGLGAWKDDEDHSKGRYETSYESPLSAIYGRIEADPVVDERYKDTGKLLERLKENVDKSYKVSVEIDMEDLSQAGYRISRPNPGDYIMAINETLGFRQKVRIVSFTSEYDVGGNLISRKVVCNDIGTVQRVTSEISHLSRTLTDSIEGSERALKTATKALVSADGKNTNYFGDVKPLDVPKGTLRKGDRLFLTVGDKKQLYFWNGAEWELEPTEFDHEKFDMEFNRKSQEIKKTIQENRQKAEEALRNAGASSLLAQEAKRIGLDSVAKLEEFKRQATSAQIALSGDLDVLKRTIANDIRPKQAQAEAEIAKQVEALIQTKNELAGVKSAQATYEETTTRRLSELANLANGKASKSELTQTADELKSRIASVQVGGTNLYALSKNKDILRSSHLTDLKFDISSGEISFKATGLDPYFGEATVHPKSVSDRNGVRIPVIFGKAIYVTVSNPIFIKNYISYFDEHGNTVKSYKFYKSSSFVIFPKELEGANFITMRFGCGGSDFEIGSVIKTKIKVEYGTIPTDWSPAPEDIEGQISAVESNFKQRADSLDAGVSRLTEGLRTKADISALNVTAENIRQSVKSLETDTQNKLNQMLSLAEFEVRAGSIRQQILNATKDKADKTLVVAEAGKLREEFSSLRVGGTNLLAYANFNFGGYYQHSLKRDQKYVYSNLIEVTNTDYILQIWELEPQNKKIWAGLQFFDEQRQPLENGYSTFWFSDYFKKIIKLPENAKYIAISFEKILLEKEMAKFKLEIGNVATDWSPAPEDTDGLITEARSVFERTAQGLRTDLSAIQEYVNKDGQRQEALQRYTREESARQATAVRELVAREYVGKSTYQEDVRGIERRFDAITNPQNGSIATQIAKYKTAVDGRFADITSLIAGKANQTDFQRVRETSQLYERILGNTNNSIADNVARMVMTNQLFQIEVSKNEGLKTVQRQLAGSWSVQNINSAGDLISGLNLGANGHNRLSGKLTHITGETLIERAVIKSAMVDKLKTANFEAGSVTTIVLDAEAVTAEKIKVDQALFNKLVANEAYLSQLFAKQAFINRVQSVAIDASQVRSGILSGDRIYGGTIRGASIYGGTLTGHTQIQLGSYGSFDTVNGGLQINVPRDYNAKDGLGVQFIGSYGRGENVPYGLFLYRDSDFTIGNTATDTDEFLMTVQGYINAKGIGWLKTGKGSVNGKTTGTIGLWNSDNVSLSFGGSGNDIYYSYNSTAYSLWSVVNQHFSDRRLKENIVDCKHKALDYIHQFQFKEYDWKKQEDRPQQAHTKIGLIAQEVQEVDPTLVYENGDTLNLDNLRLTNIALKAIQELALENQKLTHRLENLENERRTA